MDRDGQSGSYQPLSYYELQGYDTTAIEAHCPCEDHDVLGKTYKLNIHTVSSEMVHSAIERRLTNLESVAAQRSRNAPNDADLALQELPLSLLPSSSAGGSKQKDNKKRKLTDAEKELAKRAKQADKAKEAQRTAATSASVKHLPGLKKTLEKLDEKVAKLGEDFHQFPEATRSLVSGAQTELRDAVDAAAKLLDEASKGRPQQGDLPWTKEKDLLAKKKNAEAALRALNSAARSGNENKAPKAKAKAKSKQ